MSGIWPPDVGGPATHGPDLARFLVERGHEVVALTQADGEPTERPCRVVTVSRGLPFALPYALLTARAVPVARAADVVYASATYAAAATAAAAARRPLVVKLVSDPAFERARRWGRFARSLEEFQGAPGAALAALRSARTRFLRRARRIVVPSSYLAAIAAGWGLDERRIEVVPNPAPAAGVAEPEPLPPNTFVFAGRLTAQKGLATAIEALALVPAARLVLVGDGPDRADLERRAREAGLNGRVEFRGVRPREEVLQALAGAEAALLPSEWENLPHAAVESLAVGTPVLGTPVGGVPEVVVDGVNGLLVEPRSATALAAAMERLLGDRELRDRLAGAARESVAHLDREVVYGRLEEILGEARR